MLEEFKKSNNKPTVQYIVVDQKGMILESDDVFYSSILTKHISSLHPFFESIQNLLDTKSPDVLFSCIHLETNNKTIIADITLKPFKKKFIVIIQDLTAHYNNYQLTAQRRNESVINSQILELKNSYLKEKEEFKNTFIANFSHEIREPLSGISTFTDFLSKTDLNSEQKDYLNIIKSASSHLKHMIEDILDLSKIEAGKLSLIEESFNLNHFIEELIITHKISAQEKALLFEYNIDPKLPEQLIGDHFRLKQILNNLLKNATKYTTEGKIKLNVTLNQIRANKANINFEISDTGIGIKEEHLKDVFNRFTQVNKQSPQKGAGLGLAIVKNLVELLQGNTTIKSTPNKGTTIAVNLSYKIDNLPKKKKTQAPTSVIEKLSTKHSIILVEHAEITQLSVLKIFAAHGQFYLDIISNPENLIPTLQKQKVDLILMDINLPGASGVELTKQIRKLPGKKFKNLPIIALTGKLFPEDLKTYKKAKINDVITKPFNESTLINTINNYLK